MTTQPQILNLDDFETEIDKTVILNGVKHNFQPFSVADFIKNLKEIEAHAKAETIEPSAYMEHMIAMVRRAFPTIPQEDLDNLSMEKLKHLNEFIRGQTEYEAARGIEQAGEEAPKN